MTYFSKSNSCTYSFVCQDLFKRQMYSEDATKLGYPLEIKIAFIWPSLWIAELQQEIGIYYEFKSWRAQSQEIHTKQMQPPLTSLALRWGESCPASCQFWCTWARRKQKRKEKKPGDFHFPESEKIANSLQTAFYLCLTLPTDLLLKTSKWMFGFALILWNESTQEMGKW